MEPEILMEVHTAEDESVTFAVSPFAIHAFANQYARQGMKVSMHFLLGEEIAARRAKVKADTLFQGQQLPC
jgi:hypothetical protein